MCNDDDGGDGDDGGMSMDAAQLVVKYKTQNICLFLVSLSTLWVMPLMGFHCSFGRSVASILFVCATLAFYFISSVDFRIR